MPSACCVTVANRRRRTNGNRRRHNYRTGVVCLDSAETYYICNGNTMIEVYGKETAVLALTQAWLEEAVR